MKNYLNTICAVVLFLIQSQVVNSQDFSIIETTFNAGSAGTSTHNVRALDYANNTASLSQYGGTIGVQLVATGHFRTAFYQNNWYMVDPDGYLYFGIGVNSVEASSNYSGLSLPEDLKDIGVNHLANWSDYDVINSGSQKIPYVFRELFILGYKNETQANKDLYADGIIPVFDAAFLTYADNLAQTVALKKNDPYCIGVFSDNEMPIYSNTTYGELLDRYLAISDPTNANYIAADDWMKERDGSNYSIDSSDRAAFHGYLLSNYYRIVNTAIKKYAPDMLYLGSRLHGAAKGYESIYKDSAPYIDVFSVNWYGGSEPDTSLLEMWTDVSGKPFMISEFYAKGFDVGLDNSGGAGYHVPTQADRAAYYENFIITLLESKGCLGYEWFRFQDDSSNKGLINVNSDWYTDLKNSFTEMNQDIYKLREFLTINMYSEASSSVTVTQDSFVRGGTYGDVNNDNDELRVKKSTNDSYSRQTWLQFDLSGYSTIEITSAVLHLSGNQTAGSPFTISVCTASNSWLENTITWNNAPALYSSISTFTTLGNTGTVYHDFQADLTDYIKSEIDGGVHTISLTLLDIATTNEQFKMSNKEGSGTAAYIEITYKSLTGTTYIETTEDTYIRNGSSSTTNYGTDTALLIKGSSNSNYERKALLQFDLTNYNAITSAKLYVYGSAQTDVELSIYKAGSDSWTEASVSWSNTASFGSYINTFTVGTSDKWYEVDVTQAAKDDIGGNKTLSLGLKDTAILSKIVTLLSKENSLNVVPYLKIEGTLNSIQSKSSNKKIKQIDALKDTNSEELTVYPNPVSKTLHLKANGIIHSVDILTLDGRLVKTFKNILSEKFEIDVSVFDTGIYIINIQQSNGGGDQRRFVVD